MSASLSYRVTHRLNDEENLDWVHFFQTVAGWISLQFTSKTVKRLTFGHKNHSEAREAVTLRLAAEAKLVKTSSQLPTAPQKWIKDLTAFTDGTPTDLQRIPIDLSHLTAFGQAVSLACREITWGQIASYKDLAQAAGSPKAFRAVGGIMANNRYPLIVPCHRITASNGKLTGFSAPGGLVTKQVLLDKEQRTLFSTQL